MPIEEKALEFMGKLPDTAGGQQTREQIQFVAAIEDARRQVSRGEHVPHAEVRDLLSKWVSG